MKSFQPIPSAPISSQPLVFFAVVLLTLLTAAIPGKLAASSEPKVIEITAKRFSFTPDKITLKKGESVILRLKSEDVTHGFFQRALKLDEEIPAGKSADINLTPSTAGNFLTICHHFCGVGHGGMHMLIVVE